MIPPHYFLQLYTQHAWNLSKYSQTFQTRRVKEQSKIARIGGVSVLLIGHDYDVTYTIPQTVFKYIVTKTGAHFDLLGRCLTEEQNQSYKAMV